VLKYLARYTHRVAIANSRLVAMDSTTVSFRWKDYAHRCKRRVMTLPAVEFLRRFLLHVLPRAFVRIRYYGFLANRQRAENLARCRQLIREYHATDAQPHEDVSATPHTEESTTPAGPCPVCKTGTMIVVSFFAADAAIAKPVTTVEINDTS
jgi:hypothetical protein